MTTDDLQALLEALLFVSARPLTAEMMSEVTGAEKKTVAKTLEDLAEDYDRRSRGVFLAQVAGGYQLRTREEFAPQIGALFQKKSRRRFTRSALESLAIIAYRQPATRSEVEQIRGVDSGGVMKTLLSQDMIRVLGRKEAPGRPILYGTTRQFLEYFGLRDLESLPTLKEVAELLEEKGEEARPALGDEIAAGETEVRTQNTESINADPPGAGEADDGLPDSPGTNNHD